MSSAPGASRGDATRDPIRVLMLTPTYPLNATDSSGIFVKRLAVHLVEEGAHVTVLTSSDRERGPEGADGVEVVRVRYCPRRLERLFYRPSGGIPQRLRDRSPLLLLLPLFFLSYFWIALWRGRTHDIIHCHWLPTAFFGILPAVLWRKPLVIALRGSDVSVFGSSFLGRLFQRFVLLFNPRIVAVSNAFSDDNAGLIDALRDRLVPMPNGVAKAPADSLRAHAPGGELRRLLFVGNHVRAKGVFELMAAFDRVAGTRPDVTLTLVGDLDTDCAEIRDWIAARSQGVRHAGMLTQEEVLRTMQEHDLLVFPSHREGRPNVVMEAAANGLPILASYLPGIAEVLTNGVHALLVPPRDPDQLTDKLLWCLSHPHELRRCAERAAARIAELQLDWASCARRHLDFYHECLERTGVPAPDGRHEL